ncbi:hypothetical protein ES707_16088 [subsurface metagenome]
MTNFQIRNTVGITIAIIHIGILNVMEARKAFFTATKTTIIALRKLIFANKDTIPEASKVPAVVPKTVMIRTRRFFLREIVFSSFCIVVSLQVLSLAVRRCGCHGTGSERPRLSGRIVSFVPWLRLSAACLPSSNYRFSYHYLGARRASTELQDSTGWVGSGKMDFGISTRAVFWGSTIWQTLRSPTALISMLISSRLRPVF